ncbi:MAG TPA: methylenetetrahydrofolate reductase [Dongiaceae bacterium]|jgi:5,10-methylenetetrahydrofolate reductase
MSLRQYVDPGDPLPPIEGHSSRGRLERLLREGKFAVTAELNPPDSADPQDVYDRALVLSEVCDAINATDASGANVHMSSVGICSLLTRAGYAVVMQISCRDRNRIAIQGDVLGAAAMGVANILCLTGDGVQAGDQPAAKPVFDLDSMSLLETIRGMRDRRVFLSGRKITQAPQVFLGAAANPFAPPYDYRPIHLAKKVAAGAQFIQTQYCYDMPLLERFMAKVRDLGLHEKCFILVGVGPLASARGARWMRSNVPGIHVPDPVIDRLEKAKDQKLEGKKVCIELIQQIRDIKGVAGVHVMAYRQEELVSEIIVSSGIMKDRASRRPAKERTI